MDVLEDVSVAAIVEAIEANLTVSTLYGRRYAAGAIVYEDEELVSVCCGDAGPNAVTRSRFGDGELDGRVAEVMAAFKARNVSMLWWVWPSTRPVELGEFLEAQGLIYRGEGPGMAMQLSALPDALSVPEGLTIEVVRDRQTLKEWLYTGNLAASGTAEAVSEGVLAFEERLGFDVPYRRYLGRLDGEPVATSAVFFGAGVAGLSWVTTLSQARGRGIGTPLTRAPLFDARVLGYRTAVLLSSPRGYPVYSRLGFREYCRVRSYLLRPEKER